MHNFSKTVNEFPNIDVVHKFQTTYFFKKLKNYKTQIFIKFMSKKFKMEKIKFHNIFLICKKYLKILTFLVFQKYFKNLKYFKMSNKVHKGKKGN